MRHSAAVLFLALTGVLNQVGTGNVPPHERRVLMEFFAATGGDRWSNRDGWGSERSECDWKGVWCDFPDGIASRPVVAGLELSLNNLEGVLPASLLQLQYLRSLTVAGNRLSGTVPEAILERWDRHEFEFDGGGNAFANLAVRATLEYSASGTLCSATGDVRYRVELDEPKNRAMLQSVRCASARSRNTYCLVREGTPPPLARLSRGLARLGFKTFRPQYDFGFGFVTHAAYLTTAAVWGDGSSASVETYAGQGPIEVWSAQQLFLGLLAEVSWERESRKPKCDFQK
jgi:hypothetical protein